MTSASWFRAPPRHQPGAHANAGRPQESRSPSVGIELALAALAVLTAIRLAVAALAPLAPDEAYYWVWSHDLQPGYLDAPPMVALWIRAGTLIAGQGALGVRLLAPLSTALGSVLLYRAGQALLPGSGLLAAALLNATLLFGAGAVIMTPDTPLLFFWVCALWAAAMFYRDGHQGWLIAVGVFVGLAGDSKYTAAFLGFGIGLWLLITPEFRRVFLRPPVWLGAFFGALAMAPMIEWNRAHHWVSFIKQGGRVGHFTPDRALRYLTELVFGQIGLATPLIALLFAAGIVLAVRLAWRSRDPAWTLLTLLTVPAAALFVQHALGDRVQANWPAILYPAAAIAACGLAGRFWLRLRAPAVGLGFAITGAVYLQAAASPFPLPVRFDPTALQLGGWSGLGAEVADQARAHGAAFVAADDYGVAAELARSVPAPLPVIGVEPRWAYFTLPSPGVSGETGLLVRSARRGGDPDTAAFASAQPLGEVVRAKDGEPIERYRVFLVRLRGNTAAAVMPTKSR